MTLLYPEELSDYTKYDPIRHQFKDAIGYTLTPEDEWDKVTYYCKSWLAYDRGFVYVLFNPNMPGILKIGFTNKSVEERVKEINSATGVISKYEISFIYECRNAYSLEQLVHSELEQNGLRVNTRREGFKVELNKVVQLIEYFGSQFQGKRLFLLGNLDN